MVPKGKTKKMKRSRERKGEKGKGKDRNAKEATEKQGTEGKVITLCDAFRYLLSLQVYIYIYSGKRLSDAEGRDRVPFREGSRGRVREGENPSSLDEGPPVTVSILEDLFSFVGHSKAALKNIVVKIDPFNNNRCQKCIKRVPNVFQN